MLAFPRELTPNRFCWLADAVRPADDLSRFHFFTAVLHRPLVGFHGEHLLVRASVEAAVGWDFGPNVKVEDAYFALTFLERYSAGSTFLNSLSYGASPATVGDLVKQRRRWAAGLFALAFDRRFRWSAKAPLVYAVLQWGIGLFQHVGLVLLAAYLLGSPSTSPVVRAVGAIWAFNLCYSLWLYLEGLRLNLVAAGLRRNLVAPLRRRDYVTNALAVTLLQPVFAAAEGWGAFGASSTS